MSRRIPKLCLHRPTGQGRVIIEGQHHYCGPFGSPECQRRYESLIRDWLTGRAARPSPGHHGTVADLCAEYWRYADARYRDRTTGRPTKQHARIKTAVGWLVRAAGAHRLDEFGGPALEVVREQMVSRDYTRRYVNHLVGCIKAAFRWGLHRGMVPAEQAAQIGAMRILTAQDAGRDSLPVLAVPSWAVEATLPHLHTTAAAMVRLQLLTGMRPSELCRLRPCDISRDPSRPVRLPGSGHQVAAVRVGGAVVWLYVPPSHKTANRGKPRIIPLGPDAQAVLMPWLDRDPSRPCFSPAEVCARLYADHSRRSRSPRDQYDPCSYQRAVTAGIQRANKQAARDGSPAVPHWTPYQLRHAAATRLATEIDQDAAGAVLGHSRSDTTATYLALLVERAARAAAKCG